VDSRIQLFKLHDPKSERKLHILNVDVSFCFRGLKRHAYCRLYGLSQLATSGEGELKINVRSVSEGKLS
jgi:hypothetical protein